MKTKSYNLKVSSFTLLMIMLGMLLSINTFAQEDDDEKKKVHIKKVTVENGEKVVIDTILYIDDINDLHDLEFMEDVHIEDIDKDDGGKIIIIKTEDGDHDDIHMIIESEFDDEYIKIKVVDGDTIIKKSVKKVTIETEKEGTYKIHISEEDGDDVKTMIFITEDGETEVITGEGEHKYMIIKKADDGDSDDEKILMWISEDGEKIEIREIGEDGDLKWISEDGEEHELKEGKIITKEIEVTIEIEDDDDDDDDGNKKKKRKK